MPKNHRALSKQPGGFLHFLGLFVKGDTVTENREHRARTQYVGVKSEIHRVEVPSRKPGKDRPPAEEIASLRKIREMAQDNAQFTVVTGRRCV